MEDLEIVNIYEEASKYNPYKNISLASIGNAGVRLSINHGSYPWHYHPNSDELFYVLDGCLEVRTPMSSVLLNNDQFHFVSAGKIHKTSSKIKTMNLTFGASNKLTKFLERSRIGELVETKEQPKSRETTSFSVNNFKVKVFDLNDETDWSGDKSYSTIFIVINGRMSFRFKNDSTIEMKKGDLIRFPRMTKGVLLPHSNSRYLIYGAR